MQVHLVRDEWFGVCEIFTNLVNAENMVANNPDYNLNILSWEVK